MLTSYNPIMGEHRIPRFFLQRCPNPRPHTAFVVYRKKHPPFVWRSDKVLTGSETRPGSYKSIHEIDMGEHVLEHHSHLPCKGSSHHFETIIRFTCSVGDPLLLLENNICNLLFYHLYFFILQCIRSIFAFPTKDFKQLSSFD